MKLLLMLIILKFIYYFLILIVWSKDLSHIDTPECRAHMNSISLISNLWVASVATPGPCSACHVSSFHNQNSCPSHTVQRRTQSTPGSHRCRKLNIERDRQSEAVDKKFQDLRGGGIWREPSLGRRNKTGLMTPRRFSSRYLWRLLF